MRLFLVAFLTAMFSISSSVQAHVLDGAKEWNSHYYKVIQISLEWEQASKFCQSMGGHLATAETADENEFLKQIFFKNEGASRCWIGGTRDKQKIWRWVTGKVIADYFDWSNGEPRSDGNVGGPSLCLSRNRNVIKWDNLWSSNKYIFICEWERYEDAHDSTL